MAWRLLLSLALGIDAALVGGLLLNWLYPLVGQGLAGGPIALFRALVAGIIAASLTFVLFPRIPSTLARKLLYLFGIPALALVVLLAINLRQNQLQQSAHIGALTANLPPFRIYLAPSENMRSPEFMDIQFDSALQMYSVRYQVDHSCTGSLPERATEKVKLLQALRGIEGIFLDKPALCNLHSEGWLYKLNFEIHDYKPPHVQHSILLDQACLDTYPAIGAAIEVIVQVHDELQQGERCE